MTLSSDIRWYSFDQVLAIEESDRQFLALKNLWYSISQKLCPLYNRHQVQDFFLLIVLENALISYQIAGSGEQRWEEFADRLESDFVALFTGFLMWNTNEERFYNLMTTSKYNKRLYNLKYTRLKKFLTKKWVDMYRYYQDMEQLLLDLSLVMHMEKTAKTMAFAVKMFGYAARIVYGEFIPYPMSIRIPVDSRIRKLWQKKDVDLTDRDIQEDIQSLAERMNIAPLHIDSLLWIKVWKELKT